MLSLLKSAKACCLIINLLTEIEWDQSRWDRFVERHPRGGIFHTSAMVRVFQATQGYTPLPLAALDDDGNILAMLVAVRVSAQPGPMGAFASRSVWYAEPLCVDSEAGIAALGELIARHDRVMRRRVLFAEAQPSHGSGPERVALEASGYELLDYLNFVVDTTRPHEIVWNNMRESARASIRKCIERGFQVRHVNDQEGVDTLVSLLHDTYREADLPLVDRSLFEAALCILRPLGMIEFVGVYDGDRAIAMDAILPFKNQVVAWYGGSVRMSTISPVDLLQWHELRWSSDQGYEKFDLGGAGWPDIPFGVRDYKAKFGGELVCFGRYRKVYAPWKMALMERAYHFGKSMT
jgi:serine/alanine adding enzyme